MTDRRYVCPNCADPFSSSKAFIRHLLEEAGPHGATTNDLLRAGAGSRYGARIYELRHHDGLSIEERPIEGGSVYTLTPGAVLALAPPAPASWPAGALDQGGRVDPPACSPPSSPDGAGADSAPDGQLFDTVSMEFDHMVTRSPLDAEAA